MSSNGTTFVPATSTPTSANDTITVRSPHTVTVTVNVDADQLTIDSGGKVLVNSGVTFTIADGTGTDMTVNGNITTAGNLTISGQATVNGSLTMASSSASVNTNPPTYATDSTLIYDVNSNNFFPRGLEWSATSGPGYPYHVQIQNGTFLDLGGASPAVARQIAGSLTINNGGELSMDAAAMTAALTVNGNVTNNGTLTLSSQSGGDLNVGGNFTNNNATFTANGRTTQFIGSALQTISGASTINFFGFTVAANANVTAASNFNVAGQWTNNGAYSGGGRTVTFNGSSAQTIGGASASSFSSLTDSNTGAGLSLTQNQTVANTLTLSTGDLTTGASVLTQGGTTQPTAYDVVGNVRRADLGATPRQFGNPNVQVTFPNGTPPSEMTINLVKMRPTGPGFGFPNAVNRTYTVTPTGGSGYTATLRFHYRDSELSGNPPVGEEGLLDLWRFNGTVWQRVIKTSASILTTDENYVESNAVTQFSPWTISAMPLAPTAVKFGGARVESYAEGVLLSWQTGREVNNLGYNIYRELGGQKIKANDYLVAGSALQVGAETVMGAGDNYQWFDAQGSPSAQYWIEDIDLDGTRTMHGPFVPVAGTGDGKRLRQAYGQQPQSFADLNKAAAMAAQNGGDRNDNVLQMGWPTAASVGDGSSAPAAKDRQQQAFKSVLSNKTGALSAPLKDYIAQQWQLASRPAVKIGVRRDGWYRVTQAELVAAAEGLDPNADPRFLQLYVGGRQVPMRVNASQSVLGPNDSIEFYGQAFDTQSTDKRIYWLVSGSAPGLRIAGQPQQGITKRLSSNDATTTTTSPLVGGTVGAQSFDYTVERKERVIYFSSVLNGEAENYFGQVLSAQPVTQSLNVRQLATEGAGQKDATLELALQGVSAGGHAVSVYFNDTKLDRNVVFADKDHARAEFTIPAALVREGENRVKFAGASGTSSDVSLIDYVRLTYAHTYTAEDDALNLRVASRGAFRIDGFTTRNVSVFDVTDPAGVVELPASAETGGGAGGYAVRVKSNVGRQLIAVADGGAKRAADVTANQPSEWNGGGGTQAQADMIIITHARLRQSVEPLKAKRESEGLRVQVVDVEDLYDEFAFGAHTPQAIKDFLRWTATGHWQLAPRYVLFAGDATTDPRNYEGRGDFDLVPTKLIDTTAMETASDEWLADFDGDGVAEMALGRLPVRTEEESQSLISKMVHFSPQSANLAALMVADKSGGGATDPDFAAANKTLAAFLPSGTSVSQINRADGTVDAVRSQIVQGVNAGPMIVQFTGHGSTMRWTGDDLLRTADARSLANGERLPLFVLMTCLNGYFTGTASDSLSESILKAPQGGAVAVWASTGMTEPNAQQGANRELYRQLFGATSPSGVTLGEAVRRAKLATEDGDVRRTWVLFGDPTLKLR